MYKYSTNHQKYDKIVSVLDKKQKTTNTTGDTYKQTSQGERRDKTTSKHNIS